MKDATERNSKDGILFGMGNPPEHVAKVLPDASDLLSFDESEAGTLIAASFDHVLEALQTVRLREAGLQETAIHDALSAALTSAGIAHRREYTFGPRCRADLWVSGIAIEVKKQRPARAALLAQIKRYAKHPVICGLIVVLERSIDLPAMIEGKRVAMLSLNALWGIAL
jgi:hypothetical protein